MIPRFYFFRSQRASELLELFFVSAIITVLFTRFYLMITGYPQLGGQTLHIAHLLPGGLLMLASITLLSGFIGIRTQRLAAVVGGVGFGLFIDEIGKFITRDNDYFFQPSVALIYLIFVGLFIGFRAIAARRRYSKREYLINSLIMLEEAVIHDMDTYERRRVLENLHRADQNHPLVKALVPVLEGMEALPPSQPDVVVRIKHQISHLYQRLVSARYSEKAIDVVLFAVVVLSLVSLAFQFSVSGLSLQANTGITIAAVLQALSALAAAVFFVRGARKLKSDRLRAYQLFRTGFLIDILLTQFFHFYRDQFSALPNLVIYLVLYGLLGAAMHQEHRLPGRAAVNAAPKAAARAGKSGR